MKNTKKKIINICKSSIKASQILSKSKSSERNKALKIIAKKSLKIKTISYFKIKKIFMKQKKVNLSKSFVDRLLLIIKGYCIYPEIFLILSN